MIRDLKVLGLVLVAVLATGALAATAASAQQGVFTTDGASATLDTKENVGGSNKLTAFGGNTVCPGTVFTAHEVGSATKGVPNGATITTLIPDFGPCTTTDAGGSKFPVTMDVNGCDLVFHLGSTTGGTANTYGVTGTIVCKNAGEHIQMTLFSSAAHTLRVCTLTITAPAGGVTGAHITTNTISDDYDLKGAFGNFTVHKSGLCGAGEDKAVSLHIDVTVTGTNAAKEPTGITVTDQ